MTTASCPLVLCLSGHDPGGGAGVQADIEAIAALGGHALTVITAHTVQDTTDVARVVPAELALLREQLDLVLADCRVGAVKIGLLGDAAQVEVLAATIRKLRVPVVLDPVLRAGGGTELATARLVECLRQELIPLADVLTPNAVEARRLVPDAATIDAQGQALVTLGAHNVLVTGGDEPGDPVLNHWFSAKAAPRRFAWPRVLGHFHGAGCTLASAIAALLAAGLPVAQALEDAQAYTHRALTRGRAIGRGRKIPRRIGS